MTSWRTDPAFIRGYTAPGSGFYRYLEITGTDPYPAGLNHGFDLDAAGAVQLFSVSSAVPEPATAELLALPLLLAFGRRRACPMR